MFKSFKYLIIDEDGDVTGTNSEAVAEEKARNQDEFFRVIQLEASQVPDQDTLLAMAQVLDSDMEPQEIAEVF